MMSDHVTAVCRSAYYQLRQLRTIARSLSDDAAKTLVQAFISCRLDYCSALLCGISDGLVQRMQSVQNAAARLVTGAGGREHITSVLRQLHWLPEGQTNRLESHGAGVQVAPPPRPAVPIRRLPTRTRHGRRTSAPPFS